MSGAWNPTHWLSVPRGSFKPAPGVAMAPHLQLVRPVSDAYELNVWVADQLTLQIEVAVKFAPRDAAGSAPPAPGARKTEPPEDLHRFLRQARCAAKIADPHLLQILEQGRLKGGIPFLVTELLEGKSLSQRLRAGPLSISHAHAVLSQAAGVLAKAHPLGLWHGSLCPEHLFLIEAGGAPFLKIANFGDVTLETWANDPASHLSPDAPSRRQAYLSPEQLVHGTGSSAAADIWSLGVLLYELLTTTLPFEAATSAGVSVAICNAQFAPPSHYRADLPPAVDAWFSRVFAREQNTRLLDPLVLAREFARAIGAQGGGKSRDAAGLRLEDAPVAGPGVELAAEYDGDERTVRWELPSDWSLPRVSSDSFSSVQQPERPSLLPSSGPPPLPDRQRSSYPPPPYPGYDAAASFHAPPPARLPSLTPILGRSVARRYRFSKGQGWAAGVLLGGGFAFLAWGMQSRPGTTEAVREAEPAAQTRSAPLTVSPAPRHPRQPSDNENLPVILQTDELPRAPDETEEEQDGTSRAVTRPAARTVASTAATPSVARPESKAKPDPGAKVTAAPAKPKALPASPAATPRRETPHSSAQQESASADCNPPYFFDKNNIRRLKLECL